MTRPYLPGASDGIPSRPAPKSAIPQLMRSFFELPFRARAALAVGGCLPFTEAIDLSEAVEIDLTAQATPEASIGAALTTAGAIVDPRRRIAVLRQDASVTGGFNIPAGTLLVSPNGSKIVRAGGSAACNIYDGAGIIGVELHNISMTLNAVSGNGWRNTDARVIGCKFVRTADGTGPTTGMIRQNGTPEVTWTRILWNELDMSPAYTEGGNVGYGILQQRSQLQHIAFNKVKGAPGGARGIFWEGGSARCVIEHNWIDGAIVGLGQLHSRTKRHGSERNHLRWNFVANTTEEAISFDGYGSDAAQSAPYDCCQIAGVTGTAASNPAIVVDKPNGLGSLPDPADADVTKRYTPEPGRYIFLVVLQGPMAGRAIKVIGYTVNAEGTQVTFNLRNNSVPQADFAALAGKYVSIQIGAFDNYIYENYTHNSRGSLVSWGVTLECKWIRNISDRAGNAQYKGALSLTSMYGVTTTSPSVAARVFSISGAHDIVAGNAIVNSLPTTQHISQGASYTGSDPRPFIDIIPTYADGNDVAPNPWSRTFGGVTTKWGEAAFGNKVPTPAGFSSSFLYNWNDVGQPHGRHTSEILKRRQRFTAARTLTAGQTTVVIPHDLAAPPRLRRAAPLNALAAAQPFYLAASSTDITITYNAAPGAGSAQWDIEIEV